MTEHDLEFYRRLLKERDARIASLEDALQQATYRERSGAVRVAWKEHVDLAQINPIFSEVHEAA